MPSSKKNEDADKSAKESTREKNFENARETARVNHEAHEGQNSTGGYDGVEVRDAKPVEVINPVRNQATGELEDDTRTIKSTPEEEVGADTSSSKKSDSKSDDK